jgi:hypothetical protein
MTIQSNNLQSVIASVSGFANGVTCNIAGTTQTCTPQVSPASSPVTLTANITAGTFVGWSGDCAAGSQTGPETYTATLVVPPNATSLTCTLTVSGAQPGLVPVTINLASASGNAANVWITSSPAGISQTNCSLTGKQSSCSVLLQSGQQYTLTPNPAPLATFVGWSGDCVPTGAGAQTALLNMATTRAQFACTLNVQ